MDAPDIQPQELRSERISLALTEHEKRAVEFVAKAWRYSAAGLVLRDHSLTDVVREYDALRSMMAA